MKKSKLFIMLVFTCIVLNTLVTYADELNVVQNCKPYIPGKTLSVSTFITFTGQLTSIYFSTTFPKGWEFSNVSVQHIDTNDIILSESNGLIEIALVEIPESPIKVEYKLVVPIGEFNTQIINTLVKYRMGVGSELTYSTDPLIVEKVPSIEDAIYALKVVSGLSGLQSKENVTFFVLSLDGCIKLDNFGNWEIFKSGYHYAIEIFENKIFLLQSQYIQVYNLSGIKIETINLPTDLYFVEFSVLSHNKIALLNNKDNEIYIISNDGLLQHTAKMLTASNSHLQNLNGILVGNKFIISEDGNNNLLSMNIDTYEVTIFRDLSHLSGWLGAISYYNGKYYICQSKTIYSFTDESELKQIVSLPDGNITGISIINNYAYVTVNFSGKVYQVNLITGTYDIFSENIYRPDDIECFIDYSR